MIENSQMGSVSELIEELKDGDREAMTELWNRYISRLVDHVCRKLRTASKRVSDEEDVVAVAFASFFKALETGKYSDLKDRDEFWRVLVTIADRQATDQIRFNQRKKRGEGVRGDSAFTSGDGVSLRGGFDSLASLTPTPELAVCVEEEFRRLMECLGSVEERIPEGELVEIAQYKFEGYTNIEIASIIGRSIPTVERRVKLIRKIWSSQPSHE